MSQITDFSQQVYDTLTDELLDEYRVPGVENAYAQGSICSSLYEKAVHAGWALSQQIGAQHDDMCPEIQQMMDCMMEMQKILCLKMFAYGVQFADK